ncbi:hypothetical protein HPB51_029690 [Rhipicephalus microplus]|uniref:Uncharacterized protein n=1 Tax=Rhipicephalus microplus TaxID=6941 RepID=A0A9J6CTU9_RHIMP|nr:hypothetical protein HPB51_029690 [Rhipicephalus microplus]
MQEFLELQTKRRLQSHETLVEYMYSNNAILNKAPYHLAEEERISLILSGIEDDTWANPLAAQLCGTVTELIERAALLDARRRTTMCAENDKKPSSSTRGNWKKTQPQDAVAATSAPISVPTQQQQAEPKPARSKKKTRPQEDSTQDSTQARSEGTVKTGSSFSYAITIASCKGQPPRKDTMSSPLPTPVAAMQTTPFMTSPRPHTDHQAPQVIGDLIVTGWPRSSIDLSGRRSTSWLRDEITAFLSEFSATQRVRTNFKRNLVAVETHIPTDPPL